MIRWGILGTGRIAKDFARGLMSVRDAVLTAVGSRQQATADAFARAFNARRAHPTYEDLAADTEVDAIYISTPHPLHCENTLLCLSEGKAVLCEKPFAMNAKQAAKMVAAARRRKLFLMEAMWGRFHPAQVKLRSLIREGIIGEPRLLQADFAFRAPFDAGNRLFNPALGGGALLDVGIYPISLASMIFGTPDQVAGLADIGKTGVDEQSAYLLHHKGGQLAVLHAAVRTECAQDARLFGTEGSITMTSPFWKCEQLIVQRPGRKPRTIKCPIRGNGWNYQAEEVGRCLREGRLESDVMPLDETVAIMRTLDALRKPWGLRYPNE
jgi:predicted dehydrogenase